MKCLNCGEEIRELAGQPIALDPSLLWSHMYGGPFCLPVRIATPSKTCEDCNGEGARDLVGYEPCRGCGGSGRVAL